MKIWAYKMADPGLMLAVENPHFKAFPDQFVIPVLYQATGQRARSGGIEGDRSLSISLSWGV